jgi:predicted Rossmann fold flavoprotein
MVWRGNHISNNSYRMNLNHYDVIVLGGGAAGLMAAGTAAARGKRVLLFEKNKQLGRKLRITGGGRCNIMNAEKELTKLLAYYGSGEKFLYSAFSEFGVVETRHFFESRALPLITEARNRVFPKSQKASDVVACMTRFVEKRGVDVRLGTPVRQVVVGERGIERVIATGREYTATSYILAAGGLSHPETGSTGDGFEWLRSLGHTVHQPTPTIVPLRATNPWVHALNGKVVPQVKITFRQEGVTRFSVVGDILLTHFGISGPTILNCSGKVADLLHEGPVTATIDLFPTHNIGELDTLLRTHLEAHKNKLLKNIAPEFLPPGTSDVLLAHVEGVDPEKKAHSVTREERRAMVDAFKALPLTITGLMGFDRAVVADGGVPPAELDMRTMRSRKVSNVLVVGDLLHIPRPSGGYSLQLCWTTGYVAGKHA